MRWSIVAEVSIPRGLARYGKRGYYVERDM